MNQILYQYLLVGMHKSFKLNIESKTITNSPCEKAKTYGNAGECVTMPNSIFVYISRKKIKVV